MLKILSVDIFNLSFSTNSFNHNAMIFYHHDKFYQCKDLVCTCQNRLTSLKWDFRNSLESKYLNKSLSSTRVKRSRVPSSYHFLHLCGHRGITFFTLQYTGDQPAPVIAEYLRPDRSLPSVLEDRWRTAGWHDTTQHCCVRWCRRG